jgi:hypothetical protein
VPVGAVRHAPLAVVLSALALVASAQSRLPPGVDGGGTGRATATRSVAQYLDLERALADAVRERRRDAVLQMLAPDFELRSGETLDAIDASAWLAAQQRTGEAATRVRDLAVRELGEVAVVSFFLDPEPSGKTRPTLYVVDVWRQVDHKLVIRYVSRPVHALQAPTRPRGRE